MTNSRILDLVNKIKRSATTYYNGVDYANEVLDEGSLEIIDEEFDDLVEELRELDPNNSVLTAVGWGATFPNKQSVKHRYGVLGSLPKVKVDKLTKNPINSKNCNTCKLDGLTVEVIYKDGKFFQGVTRGDGYTGIDVTSKLRHVVPNEISIKVPISFRGEFVLSIDNWKKYYPDQLSPRNVASGILNRLGSNPKELSRFDCILYKVLGFESDDSEVVTSLKSIVTDRFSQLMFMKDLGFKIVADSSEYYSENLSYSDVFELIVMIDGDKEYPCDGIVSSPVSVSVSRSDESDTYIVNYIDELAYKVVNDKIDVEVTDIEYNLSRTGRMVPKIHFTPIQLSGAVISRATAHNYKYLEDNKIGVGSIVSIVRSGEVIPYIYSVVEGKGFISSDNIVCPSCGEKVSVVGVDIKCINQNCPGKTYSAIKHWIYNLCYVKGLGDSLINSLIDNFNITSIEDLYEVDLGSATSIGGVGSSKLELLNAMYEKLKSPRTIQQFLVACNVPKLSWKGAGNLDNESFKKLLDESCSPEEVDKYLYGVKGVISSSKAYLVDNWSSILRKYALITAVTSEPESNNDTSDRLPICVTGKLVNYKTRKHLFDELSDLVVEVGIKDNGCKYLVCNADKGSSKSSYAKSHNIPIISEEDLLKLLDIKQ